MRKRKELSSDAARQDGIIQDYLLCLALGFSVFLL